MGMETAGEAANRWLSECAKKASDGSSANAQSENAKSRANVVSEPLIAALWARMAEVYGCRWAHAYGDEPLMMWRRGLADLSSAQLGHGIRACIDSGKEFPPTLPEFRSLCLHGASVIVDYEPWMNAPKALTYNPSNVTAPGDARVHLAAMRAKLRGEPTP